MESLADIYEKAKNFITLQGTQPGEQGLFGSLKTLADRGGQDLQEKAYGFRRFDEPVITHYGEASDQDSLDKMMKLAQAERTVSLADQYNPQLSAQPLAQPEVLGESTAPIQPAPIKLPKVNQFMTKKYPGTRVTPEYYSSLETSLDPETLKIAMAMSIAETGAGRDASSFRGDGTKKKFNFYGIHKSWKNADGKVMPANQYDPDLPTMIEDLKKNFGPGGRYSKINPETLAFYVRGRPYKDLDKAGKASVNAEYSRYLWARNQFD